MHLDSKVFKDSSEGRWAIRHVKANVGAGYGASIMLICNFEKKKDVIDSLSKANIPLRSVGVNSVLIHTDGIDRSNLRLALNKLSHDGLINPVFVTEISKNFPDGLMGTHSLDDTCLDSFPDVTLFGANHPVLYGVLDGAEISTKDGISTKDILKALSYMELIHPGVITPHDVPHGMKTMTIFVKQFSGRT